MEKNELRKKILKGKKNWTGREGKKEQIEVKFL